MWSLQWDAAIPLGNTSSLCSQIEKNSYKGISLEYKKCIRENILAGARVGLNSFFEEKGLSSIVFEDDTIYGNFDSHLQTVPIMLTAGYLFKSNKFVPYAGIGLGVYYIRGKSVSSSMEYETENAWHFGFSPEVGITIPFIISNFGLNINTKYNMAVKTNNAPTHSWFSFGIGLSFMY
jgi:hypothetical protein